ncbi:MAG: glutamine--fructose-6-phosphate transaminase (isomerizing) [Proteobacteria bacterium]|nr:glutamine--fructose-6-phosphate transaminase (isomerizing) [Pseudomonadota bacterium]MDA0869765.1 glutamine--fructose-6-phosphate transaminase (isomerizing) [Pseudomonadota bacterium]
MCGIVGAVAQTNSVPMLVQGLQRLEYRGYDSCGLAVQQSQGLQRSRSTARVADLQAQVQRHGLQSGVGIAHTRWATHGAPAEHNAHPHFSHGPGIDASAPQHAAARVALVHNGIIENHEALRAQLSQQGYVFASQTDTEVVVHLVDSLYQGDLLAAVRAACGQLRGAYAIAVLHANEPQHLVGARHGAPMVMGSAEGAYYLASDAMALANVAEHVMYLEDGDCVSLQANQARVIDARGETAQRAKREAGVYSQAVELGPYRHYMQKEIFEQPQALADTLEGVQALVPDLFGPAERAHATLSGCQRVLLLACGTSYYSAVVAKYWLEALAGIPTQVEVASEYRYRTSVPEPDTLVVTISQSGETADTLAALQHAKSLGLTQSLTVCNVATSAMVRECGLAYITRAGVEIGVASTKAFTTQLAGLFLLTLTLAKLRGRLSPAQEADWLRRMRHLPVALQSVLALEPQIMAWAEAFASKEHALFLGRGVHYPIALEGALKLKEISYIHAEAYPAGELKHGPLALVTADMPVVTVAPNDALLEKLKSNMQEVRARGGVLYVLADADSQLSPEPGVHLLRMPEHYGALSPMLHVVPLQLLAYHTACARGTDVDKPRNLAKSVTVE